MTPRGAKGSVVVSWRPNAKGSVVTSYIVRASGGASVTVSGSARSVRLALPKGTYTISVSAVRGTAESAPASGAKPVTVR